MPIRIPENLPGRTILEEERVPLIFEERALRQDIRPLQIAVLNLMPDKISTETQILRALGGTPLQVEVTLLHPASHESKNTSAEHLEAFYETLDSVKSRKFDGLIMTGAPVEHLPFEEVSYWDELCTIMDWAQENVYSSFFICWGAQAAMQHFYGVPKYGLDEKMFGVFPHKIHDIYDPLTAGFDSLIHVPVSRHTEVRFDDLAGHKDLKILAESDMSGLCLVKDEKARRVFMFNHLEYDSQTLKREYDRDAAAGMDTQLPYNYFPDDDPANKPPITWRAHRTLLYHNWINMVYQGTPFNLDDLANINAGWEQTPNVRTAS